MSMTSPLTLGIRADFPARNTASGVQDTLQSGVNYVSDKVNETTSGASKEANKSSSPPSSYHSTAFCPTY